MNMKIVIFIAIKNFSCISSVIKRLVHMTESMEKKPKGKEGEEHVSFTIVLRNNSTTQI